MTEMRNLYTIMRDGAVNAASFIPTNFNYTITGSGVKSLLFERSDGSYYIAVWNEAVIWDRTLHDISVSSTTVTITPSVAPSSVNIYDPIVSAVSVANYGRSTSVTFSLVDHPLIIKFTP